MDKKFDFLRGTDTPFVWDVDDEFKLRKLHQEIHNIIPFSRDYDYGFGSFGYNVDINLSHLRLLIAQSEIILPLERLTEVGKVAVRNLLFEQAVLICKTILKQPAVRERCKKKEDNSLGVFYE